MDMKTNAKKRKLLAIIRIAVQIIFFIVMPSCFSEAMSAIKNSMTAIGAGQTLEWSSFAVKLVIVLVATIVCGRIFCGWVCSFGAIGDWIYLAATPVRKKMGIKQQVFQEKTLYRLQKIKYGVLFLVLMLCLLGQSDIITRCSMWTTFAMMTAGNFQVIIFPISLVMLILTAAGMAVKERFFCQFLCPMGAVFSLMPQMPFLKPKRKQENCIENCRLCKSQCPVAVKLGENPMREGECISCYRCTNICVKDNIHVRSKNT